MTSAETATQGDRRRARILLFIAEYWSTYGYAPSVREITKGCGLSHPSSAHHHLILLERAGKIKSAPYIPRSVRVVEQ